MRCSVYLLILCGLITSSATLSTEATADDIKGFWNKGDATNFGGAVTPNSSKSVVYHDYPLVVDKAREQNRQTNSPPSIAVQLNQANMPVIGRDQKLSPQVEAPPLPAVSTPLSREQILTKFGAPDQPQAIRAQKEAPPAMQGLFEALNSGDKELAWQYAIALAKRQVAIQSTVSKATELQLMAMEAEGLKPPKPQGSGTAPLDPIRAEYKELLERSQQETLQRRASIKSEQLEGGADTEGQVALDDTPAKMQRKIPVDPEGKIRLLVFFDEQAKTAFEVANSLRAIREKFAKDTRFSAIGLTKRTYSAYGLKFKGAELSFPVSLLNGEALALDLRIHSYPTYLFWAVTTKETYRVEGPTTVDEVEKVVKAMRGGK